MTIDLFRSLSATLDQLILKVDADLPQAEDIHPAIAAAGKYLADHAALPVALAKLEAQKAAADASVPAREKSVRTANHAVTMLEAKLKKLGERIDHHLNAQSDADDAPVTTTFVLGGKPLPTRREIIEGLRKEIAGVEQEIVAAKAKVKKAEANRKGAVTRAANLAEEIVVARWAIVDHAGRVEDAVKALRKTITHLRNRQEKRDAKRAPAAAPVKVEEAADETPKGPTDEDIRKMAASQGLSIDCPDDLEAARQLFLN